MYVQYQFSFTVTPRVPRYDRTVTYHSPAVFPTRAGAAKAADEYCQNLGFFQLPARVKIVEVAVNLTTGARVFKEEV